MASEDGREEVPLRMLEGNIGVLLENKLFCKAVSLEHDPASKNAVILVIHNADHEHAEKIGFKLRKLGK